MKKVLIAEDNVLIADMLEDFLVSGGYEVCGIARTVDEAVALADLHKPDLAVLDFRLADGGYGSEIGPRLKDRGRLGILYATGNGADDGLTMADGQAYIGKPYRMQDMLRALNIVDEIRTTKGGFSSSPFPENFHLLPDCKYRQSA